MPYPLAALSIRRPQPLGGGSLGGLMQLAALSRAAPTEGGGAGSLAAMRPQDASFPRGALSDYAAPSGGNLPASIRTNNPGAMNYGPFAAGLGATQTGRFAQFATPEAGWSAMDRLLNTYRSRGQNTVASIIGGTPDNPNRAWAPRGVDNNSTDAYIANVARRLGLGPHDVIPDELWRQLSEAMATYEAGRPVSRPQY